MQAVLTLYGEGRYDEALAKVRGLLGATPDKADLRNLEGAILRALGRLEEAVAAFAAAAALAPASPQVQHNLAAVYGQLGRLEDSAGAYARVVELKPDDAEALNNLGAALERLGQVEAAAERFIEAVQRAPGHAAAFNNLGAAFRRLGRADDALACFERAAALAPAVADFHNNRGNVLRDLGRLDEAAAAYAAAVQARPGYAGALSALLAVSAQIGDWRTLDAWRPSLPALGLEGEAVLPFALLALEDEPERHLRRARRYAARYAPAEVPEPPPRPAARPDRLRIGYFSADFHSHATMHLMAQLLELHDRSRFEVVAYSFGPQAQDELRRRTVSAVDRFVEVGALSDRDAAAAARSDGIDIAVDLKGYTTQARPGILAWRPAPVAVSYLGYPGSMGAPFIDYIVADAALIPPGDEDLYDEAVVRLAGSYQVNDRARPIGAPVSRAACGLPEDGVVFCCFNAAFKIGPREFEVWMRLLAATPGAVLWLLRANPWIEASLRREAVARGVDPARLVFADRQPQAQHLARQACADLFLDTFAYNAHTTASDALWGGLPVLTLAGRGFAARVGASLLGAIGLPELITRSEADYEALALALARDPARLAAVKAKLAANRLTTPLFDTPAFTRRMEAMFDLAHARWRAGLPPAALEVA